MSLGGVLPRQQGLSKPRTILIADDSERMRAMMRRSLERETDFKICEACNGEEAVAKAKEVAPDLAILDVRMPGLNGIEVAGILRYAQPRIRIVFLTMYAEDLSESVTIGVSGGCGALEGGRFGANCRERRKFAGCAGWLSAGAWRVVSRSTCVDLSSPSICRTYGARDFCGGVPGASAPG